MNILLVEDEDRIAEFVKYVLENEHHKVSLFEMVEDVMGKIDLGNYELVILDLLLPGRPGEELLKYIRKQKIQIPVLVLSALGQISKKVELLNLGADDYMTKPFDAEELLARVNAIFRRHVQNHSEEQKECGEITFFARENKCVCNGNEIFLTNKEGELLDLLLRNKGKAIRTEDILMQVWNAKQGYHSNIVQATVRRLRKKLREHCNKDYIRNVHGIGYIVTDSNS